MATSKTNSKINSRTVTASSPIVLSGTTPSIEIRKVKIPGLVRSFTTPEVYKAGIYAVLGGTLLLSGAVISAVMAQRSVVEDVGFGTTPSIYHAQRIRDSLSDLDANVVNMLLLPSGTNPTAEKEYQSRKEKLSNLVVAVSKNITIPVYVDISKDPSKKISVPIEQKNISTITLEINNYIEKAQQARDFHALKNTPASLEAYREAQKIIGDDDSGLLKEAYALDQINFEALSKAYQSSQGSSLGQSLVVLVSGATLLGLLISLQLLLFKWNRRVINPALLGATLIAALFLLDTLVSLNTATQQLKIAKEGAFDSLHALRQLRSTAYIMNTAESRYLLDSSAVSEHEKQFSTSANKIARLGNLDPLVNSEEYQGQLQTLASQGQVIPGMSGFFATQLKNVSFPNEMDKTKMMITDFAAYLKIDKKIRSLNTSGKRDEAIKLTLGNNPGESNYAFEKLKKSNSATMDVNIDAFNKAIEKAQRVLEDPNPRKAITGGDTTIIELIPPNNFDTFWLKTLAISGAIVGLTYYGLTQRIKEYEV